MVRPAPTRRDFLKATACLGALAVGGRPLAGLARMAPLAAGTQAAASGPLAELIGAAPTARFWVSTTSAATAADCRVCHPGAELPENLAFEHATKTVQCGLCAQNCRIEEGERGLCRARMNVEGELKSLVYGRPITVHVDPIEKKPFYNFLPGSAAFSMATSGCPLRCKFCQNWEISQARPEDYRSDIISPRQVARAAVARKAPVIAFTYNEPTVFTEYLLDIAAAGRRQGRRSALVSCGFMNEAPLAAMCEALDAIKIDLKGFSRSFYHDVCGAELEPVLRSIRQVAASGTHLEIVNLVVPTLNDSADMLTELCQWVMGEVGPDVPVHFTRFHPDYQLRNLPPTPVTTLERAREIALKAGLRYPYVGNVPGHPGNNTYCPKCGQAVIERTGFFVTDVHLKGHGCAECGTAIAGVWD
jgi:pyruvate formate lyase activating enzyme